MKDTQSHGVVDETNLKEMTDTVVVRKPCLVDPVLPTMTLSSEHSVVAGVENNRTNDAILQIGGNPQP